MKKLSKEQVAEIKLELEKSHYPGIQRDLAKKYGVSAKMISHIKMGRCYKYVRKKREEQKETNEKTENKQTLSFSYAALNGIITSLYTEGVIKDGTYNTLLKLLDSFVKEVIQKIGGDD